MANRVDPDQTAPLCLPCLLPRPVSPKTLDHYGIHFIMLLGAGISDLKKKIQVLWKSSFFYI